MKPQLLFLVAVIGLDVIGLASSTIMQANSQDHPQLAESSKMPSYHESPPSVPLPLTLPPSEVPDGVTRNAYRAAAKIPALLYQLPCYCYCDRAHGHKSLHDCFIHKHAAGCPVCQREVFYAYERYLHGSTPSEIRTAISALEWADLDLSKYGKGLPDKGDSQTSGTHSKGHDR